MSGEVKLTITDHSYDPMHASKAYEIVLASDYDKLAASHAELVEIAARYANECGECGGKGWYYEGEAVTGRGPDDVAPEQAHCPECADIRTALTRAKEIA